MKQIFKIACVVGVVAFAVGGAAAPTWASPAGAQATLQVAMSWNGERRVVTLTGESKAELEAIVRLLAQGVSTKEASVLEMTEFAECAGFYTAIADNAQGRKGKESVHENALGMGAAYELAASYFGAQYTEGYEAQVAKIKADTLTYYNSGVGNIVTNEKAFMAENYKCYGKFDLQAVISQLVRNVTSQ